MNVNGLSTGSNYAGLKASNRVNCKANNQLSFGALRADVADEFIKKAAADLDPKGRNIVIENLIKLAKRAKKSCVLDIIKRDGGRIYFNNKEDSLLKLFFESTVDKGISRLYGNYLTNIVGFFTDKNGVKVVIERASGYQEPSVIKGIKKNEKLYEAPIELFTEKFIESFDNTERMIVDEIHDKEKGQALMAELAGLLKK